MRTCIVLCSLWLTWAALSEAHEFKVVCYFASWAVYRSGDGQIAIANINATLCTHLIYAFVGITEDGNIKILDPWADLPDGGGKDGFGKFVALRKSSPETKYMISIGGWNEGSVKYSNVVGNSSTRLNLVQSILNFTRTHRFDGCDVDWEYPNQRNGTEADVENFALFLKELRDALDEYGLCLSVAVAAAEGSASLSYDITKISKYVDFINLMTYEYHSSSETTAGHNAPLYPAKREKTILERRLNINASVNYWLNQGAAPEKIILGTAAYGKSFTLSNSAKNEPGSLVTRAGDAGVYSQANGTLYYYEVCKRIQNDHWKSAWDAEQCVPYAYKDNQWVSYDNAQSISEKADYAKKRCLGGAMIWTVDEDDVNGICGEKSPLLKALNAKLRNRSGPYCTKETWCHPNP